MAAFASSAVGFVEGEVLAGDEGHAAKSLAIDARGSPSYCVLRPPNYPQHDHWRVDWDPQLPPRSCVHDGEL